MPSSRELIKLIEANGWQLERINGSHHIFSHPHKPERVTIPHPKKDIPTGTAESIKRHAGLK